MYQWILRCLVFRKTIITLAFVFLAICAFGLFHLKFDVKLDVMKEGRFSEELTYITVYDKHLFDSHHLNKLAEMQERLSKIKSINKAISLYTLPNVRRYIDEKKWYSILENREYSDDALNEVKSDVLDNELFVGKFVNKNADTMIFYMYFPSDTYGDIDLQIRKEMQEILNDYQQDFSRIFQSGSSEIVYVLAQKTKLDLLICMPALFIIMSILFGWLFRSVLIAFFPSIIAGFSIFCTLGMMGWLGIPVNALFIVAIVLSLAITVASNAHIIHAYHESSVDYPSLSFNDHMLFVMKKVFLPFLLAVSCALLGFLLDILSFVRIIQDLSYAFAFCIIFNTLLTIFITPLLLSRINAQHVRDRKIFNVIKVFFLKANNVFTLFPWSVFFSLFIVCAIGIFCVTHMKIESLPYVLFKKNDALIKNTYFSSQKVSGQNILQLDIFSKEKNVFREPVFLQKILDFERELLNINGTSHIYSIADVIATTNQYFLFNTKKYFNIPKNSKILALFYSELSGQEIMQTLINRDFNSITLYVNHNFYSSQPLEAYKKTVDNLLESALKNTSFHFKIKDYWSEYARIVRNLIILQIFSILTIYLICFVVVGLLFRSFVAGMISIIPNLLPLCLIAIAQYLLNIPITLISVILYSVVVGLSVDETMHMFYSFKQQYFLSRDRHLAATSALELQAMPVTVATLAIALACLVLLGSQFYPVTQLGFLTEVGAFSTWMADLMITPFLLRKIALI